MVRSATIITLAITQIVCLLSLGARSAMAQNPPQSIPLELGMPIEKELTVGQSHNYLIKLQAGQSAQFEVEQRGINVLLNVSTRDNKFWFMVDNEWNSTGTERAIIVADVAGDYQVWIGPQAVPNDKTIPPGKYRIKIAELRQATAADKRLYASQNLFSATMWSFNQSNEKDQFIKFAQDWLRLYRNDEDVHACTTILNLLATHYVSQRNFEQSAAYHQQMIMLLQQAGDQRQLGDWLSVISSQYYYTREYQKAVGYKVQELAVWRSLGDHQLEGWALNMLGKQYLRLRQVEKALDAYALRLAVVRELRDPMLEVDALENIANVYGLLEDREKQIAYYNQALEIARASGLKSNEAWLLIQMADFIPFKEASYNLSELLKKHGKQTPQTIAMYERSRDLFRELDDPYEANPLLMLAIWHAQNGERKIALEESERALKLIQSTKQLKSPLGYQLVQSAVKSCLATVYSILGDYQKAIEFKEESYREFNGDLDGSANILVELASDLKDSNRLAEAQERLEDAIRIKESLRSRLIDEEFRTSVSSGIANAYELYADVLMQLHEQKPGQRLNEQAFLATERARARSLLDLLVEAHANIRSDVEPALLERERGLQKKINSLSPRPNDPQKNNPSAAMQKELAAALDELQKVRVQIRTSSPRFAELTEPQPPSIAEIQKQLLDADTMLLAYSLGEKRSFLWAISQNSISSYQLPAREVLTKSARRVYELLTTQQQLQAASPAQRQKQIVQAEKDYQIEAAALSEILLGSVASQLGQKRLLIVAPEALQFLPFGVLPEPEFRVSSSEFRGQNRVTQTAKPLMVNHEIINLPSVSVMMFLRQELARRKAAPKAIAVFADPVFDASDPRVKSQSLAKIDTTPTTSLLSPLNQTLRSFNLRSGLARLILSRDEAEAIVSAVPEADRLKVLDFKASRAEAMSGALSQYRIVHFATHGLLNAERPELSGLVLSLVDQAGKPQDGFLRLHEIYNLQLPADLVVLSACQTGLGKDIKGEGMIGLTRGFMYAGAARVVASLWRVDDYATSVLMKKFYRGMLQEKLRPAEALRKAQLEMMQQKQWQSPFFWGAFVLQGEWK